MQNYAQIQKAVINILLEQVLYNEPDNDLIKQVKGHCPDGTHREKGSIILTVLSMIVMVLLEFYYNSR